MSLASTDSQRPPGPEGSVKIDVSPESLLRLKELKADFGNVVEFEVASGRRGLFINDPDMVRRLLVRHHPKYRKGPGFERVEMLLGNGLIVSDGDTWRRSRTMIQPAFSRQNVHRLIALMIDCTARRRRTWQLVAEQGGTLNVSQEMSDFALELILRAIFGDDYDRRIVADGQNPFAFLSEDATRDLSVVMKMRRSRELLQSIVTERREQPEAEQYDFLSMYLQATDKQGKAFADRELLDELMTLIVAGYETSAGTLNWCWYLLAHHSEVADQLRDEARAYGPDFAGADDDPALANMAWTQQVLDETLRLYPPVWLFSRRSLQTDVLEGFEIPENADIYLSPFIMQRSEEFWAQPNTFQPQRFGADGPYKKGDRPFFPFSLGPRRCLGEYFSFLEMKIHLGMLVQHFRLQPLDNSEPQLDLGINLRSLNDIQLKPELRTDNA